jgi:hypothetical protein
LGSILATTINIVECVERVGLNTIPVYRLPLLPEAAYIKGSKLMMMMVVVVV